MEVVDAYTESDPWKPDNDQGSQSSSSKAAT